MSSKTLLETLKNVTGELGFSQPLVVLSSQVGTDIQLRSLAIAAGEELLEAYDWQALMRTHSFTVTSATQYDLPSDFHRIINQTVKIGQNYLDGSAQPSSWARLQSGELKFRIFGDKFELFEPASYVGQTVSFNYISKNFVLDGTNGLPKPDFTLDSDKTVYAPRLFTNLVKLKLKRVHGLGAEAEAEDYNSVFQTVVAGEHASPVLSLDGEQRLGPSAPWEV